MYYLSVIPERILISKIIDDVILEIMVIPGKMYEIRSLSMDGSAIQKEIFKL